jgi:hypothetical protein
MPRSDQKCELTWAGIAGGALADKRSNAWNASVAGD